MNKISSYDELCAERLQVERRIIEHKARIHEDFSKIKTRLAPIMLLLPILKFFKKEKANYPILKSATSLGIDFVAGRKVFSKSHWLLRLVVPRILKSLSGRFFSRKKVV